MSTDAPELTWQDVSRAVQQLAVERGEWGGYPVPVTGLRLHLEPRHPLREQLEGTDLSEPLDTLSRMAAEVACDGVKIVNSWWSCRKNAMVYVLKHPDGTIRAAWLPMLAGHRFTMLMRGFSPCFVWSLNAERKAMDKLAELIGDWKMKLYEMTGMFLERSPRSGVTYVFRRMRPTIAIASAEEGDVVRILCALCLHPVGYYGGSFAGAMVPTDDVICHLTMMRGDERRYWAAANQHPVWVPEAGL